MYCLQVRDLETLYWYVALLIPGQFNSAPFHEHQHKERHGPRSHFCYIQRHEGFFFAQQPQQMFASHFTRAALCV